MAEPIFNTLIDPWSRHAPPSNENDAEPFELAYFKAGTATFRKMPTPTSTLKALANQPDRFDYLLSPGQAIGIEQRIEDLERSFGTRIDALAAQVGVLSSWLKPSSSAAQGTPQPQFIKSANALGAELLDPTDLTGDAWAAALDAAADGDFSSVTLENVRDALRSQDPAVRAAAARAIARLAPSEASELLRKLRKQEENRFVVAAIDAILTSLSL